MICNKIIDNNHLFVKGNKYIVDTNVLISLYGNKKYNLQIDENKKLKKATQYYNNAISQKCTIYVPAIVLSEFVNLYFRERWSELRASNPTKYTDEKKHYRNTEKYAKDCEYIKKVIEEEIMKVAKPINDDFDKLSIENMFKFDDDDFNDRLIIHIANKNDLYVISADADIRKMKIR